MRTKLNNCLIIYLYLYKTQDKCLQYKQDLSFDEVITSVVLSNVSFHEITLYCHTQVLYIVL